MTSDRRIQYSDKTVVRASSSVTLSLCQQELVKLTIEKQEQPSPTTPNKPAPPPTTTPAERWARARTNKWDGTQVSPVTHSILSWQQRVFVLIVVGGAINRAGAGGSAQQDATDDAHCTTCLRDHLRRRGRGGGPPEASASRSQDGRAQVKSRSITATTNCGLCRFNQNIGCCVWGRR